MSERKVLNKYYPPDFDPTKIPKLKQGRNRQYSIRIMSPFNMRCNTCGEYIYKGKKFNSRKETVEDEDYLGLYIFRFYIKCPRCVAEIAFKTDPENTDYSLEAGATRNFEALRTAELLAEKEQKEKEEEESSNPMKVLENRTKASRQEMDMIETLEDLKQMNSRHAKLDHSQIIKKHQAYEEQLRLLQDEQDEEFIKSVFGSKEDEGYVRRLPDPEQDEPVPKKISKVDKPTDFLTQGSSQEDSSAAKKPGGLLLGRTAGKSSRATLSMLVKRKQPAKASGSGADSAGNGGKETGSVASGGTVKGDGTSSSSTSTSTGSGALPEQHKDSVKTLDKVVESGTAASSTVQKATSSALGMLGGYSDSSEGDST